MKYETAIRIARDLFELSDPFDTYSEYARGVINLLAEFYGKPDIETTVRMTEIAHDVGLPVRY